MRWGSSTLPGGAFAYTGPFVAVDVAVVAAFVAEH